MPGIENFAPERTETRSGFEGSPSFFPAASSILRSAFQNLVPHPVGKFLSRAVVGVAGFGRDRESRGDRQPGISHLSQAGTFAAQKILHIAAPVGMAIGKDIDILVRHSAHPRMKRKFEGVTRILEKRHPCQDRRITPVREPGATRENPQAIGEGKPLRVLSCPI